MLHPAGAHRRCRCSGRARRPRAWCTPRATHARCRRRCRRPRWRRPRTARTPGCAPPGPCTSAASGRTRRAPGAARPTPGAGLGVERFRDWEGAMLEATAPSALTKHCKLRCFGDASPSPMPAHACQDGIPTSIRCSQTQAEDMACFARRTPHAWQPEKPQSLCMRCTAREARACPGSLTRCVACSLRSRVMWRVAASAGTMLHPNPLPLAKPCCTDKLAEQHDAGASNGRRAPCRSRQRRR